MPAADPKASLIKNRRYATCYAILNTGVAEVAAGIIDRVEFQPGPNGNVDLVVSGDDRLRELTWRTVGLSTITGASGDIEGDDSYVKESPSITGTENYGYGTFSAVNATHATWAFKTVKADGGGPAGYEDHLTIVKA